MELLNQEQLEYRMAETGYARAKEIMAATEARGGADHNPYGDTILRDFVQPLAALVQQAQDSITPGRQQAHAVLLRGLDPWAVAYLSVRVTLNTVLSGDKATASTVRNLAMQIGKTLYAELYLTQFDELAPDLFFIINEDLNRRKGKDSMYRYDAFRKQAKAKGMHFAEWGQGSRDQVGCFIMEHLSRLGLIVMDVAPPRGNRALRPPLGVYLAADVTEQIDRIKEQTALTRPFYGPCVEPPKDWTSWTSGGWHTPVMRRILPFPVKARSTVRDALKTHDMPTVLACLNTLQKTPWRVNTWIMETIEAVARIRNTGEIVMAEPEAKPAALSWFEEVGDGERTPEQEEEFKGWKSAMAAWYTRAKLQRAARHRLGTALRQARDYAPYPAIYFVHFCDSRGRVYPQSQGLTPQGSDLQKALIHFAEGKPIHDPVARFWFMVQGANKFGFDKAPLDQRATWHIGKEELILAMADAPLDNQQWLDCDNPCQFLAWCKEYAAWYRDPENFVSHLPVSLDGSCSGLQHFSAMMRDEVGGRATNLMPSPIMQDIYRAVAEAATARMQADSPEEPEAQEYRSQWLSAGITRSVTKRSVMTTPYGVTKRSATKYVIEDYLRATQNQFDPKKHYGMAHYLMEHVWPAIGDVVVKGREAMDWLTLSAKSIIKQGAAPDGDITWVTPSGFLASQAYYETEEHRVHTRLLGHMRIKVLSEVDEPSRDRHANGMAPNFVHSMDASHLHRTTARLAKEVPGVCLAMIHDDFGCHAADTPTLYWVLRDEFVLMYEEHDPLAELQAKYGLTAPPAKGQLDLSVVRQSEYVFS